MTDKRSVTSEVLISYFMGELLVLKCQINVFVLKSMSRNWTIYVEKPKLRRSANFCGKTINSAARLEILWPAENCDP